VALAAGMLIIVAATSIRSGALYLIGSVVGGAGFGVAFLGALRALSASIPAEHRSSVMSAFYLVAYSSLSLPAILAGVLDTPFGLKPTFETFGTVIAARWSWPSRHGAPAPSATRNARATASSGPTATRASSNLSMPAGRPAPPGAASAKVLPTNLYNLAQPPIRYELDDTFVRPPDALDHTTSAHASKHAPARCCPLQQ
jgi:MFS family permease